MKYVRGVLAILCMSCGVAALSCDSSSTGPELGGETDLDITRVGGVFSIRLSGAAGGDVLSQLQDSVTVTRNDAGDVTIHAVLGFDSAFVAALDTALGTESLPHAAKQALIAHYAERFGATIDTADKEHMTAVVDLKLRVTSEGIQDYVYGNGDRSRPFTVVRYGANVGETWSFTDDDGRKVTRTVVHKSTEDEYPFAFWLIKVIKVEQTSESDLAEKITYIANHKFGLVGVELRTVNGKTISLGITPP